MPILNSAYFTAWYAELRIGILLKVCRFLIRHTLPNFVIRHITQTDTETETEANFTHSVFNTERALEAVDNVLYLLPDCAARERLFFTPNCKGMRPVELAAKMARPRMLLKYMNIEGVYRHTVQQCLMFKIVRYNVTHYESPILRSTSLSSIT